MIVAVMLPSFDTPEDALDWVESQGEPVRVYLMRGMDGRLRGNALVRVSTDSARETAPPSTAR